MKHPSTYRAIGLMSGTSLDGLDIAACEFNKTGSRWDFRILKAETVSYPASWKTTLSGLETSTAIEFVTADVELGHYFGKLACLFMEKHDFRPDFIASHGHTIFHQPAKMITSQIGRGSAIAAETGCPVICDFRSPDVALGGQGAPLVPIGDALLFSTFDYCLNLGGFANISFQADNLRLAFDICPVNVVLNHLAQKVDLEYDAGGKLASQGTSIPEILDKLNDLPYYKEAFPKSLGKEWVLANIHPVIYKREYPVTDLLATYCEHIAIQISKINKQQPASRMLVTGGGAFNRYLMHRIRHHGGPEIIIPDDYTVNFKEALIFAFLGLLRWRGEINCLQSVTGARRDSSGGAVYLSSFTD